MIGAVLIHPLQQLFMNEPNAIRLVNVNLFLYGKMER